MFLPRLLPETIHLDLNRLRQSWTLATLILWMGTSTTGLSSSNCIYHMDHYQGRLEYEVTYGGQVSCKPAGGAWAGVCLHAPTQIFFTINPIFAPSPSISFFFSAWSQEAYRALIDCAALHGRPLATGSSCSSRSCLRVRGRLPTDKSGM